MTTPRRSRSKNITKEEILTNASQCTSMKDFIAKYPTSYHALLRFQKKEKQMGVDGEGSFSHQIKMMLPKGVRTKVESTTIEAPKVAVEV